MQETRYSSTAVALHWLMAALVLVMFLLGWYMTSLPKGPLRLELVALHKSLGLTLGGIAIARLIWRLGHRPPPLPASLPRWRAVAARTNQALLYLALFLQPGTGYLSGVLSGQPVRYFGRALPMWGSRSKALSVFFIHVHVIDSWILLGLISLHLTGAALHAFYDRDGVVGRMLPGRQRVAPALRPLGK